MQNVAEHWLELAENNLNVSDESFEWALQPAEQRRAAAWEAVAERYVPAGLRFHW